jgi:hypothetical protein
MKGQAQRIISVRRVMPGRSFKLRQRLVVLLWQAGKTVAAALDYRPVYHNLHKPGHGSASLMRGR